MKEEQNTKLRFLNISASLCKKHGGTETDDKQSAAGICSPTPMMRDDDDVVV